MVLEGRGSTLPGHSLPLAAHMAPDHSAAAVFPDPDQPWPSPESHTVHPARVGKGIFSTLSQLLVHHECVVNDAE